MDIVKRQQILQVYKDLAPGDLAGLVKKSRHYLQDPAQDPIDPLPFVVSPDEVPFLRDAVAQWGRLLTQVYRDLWGPQSLVRPGLIDPGLLWGAMAFDPAFSGAVPGGVDPLSLVRFDVVRTAREGWRLTGLGTGVPRGLGTALETRITHGRSFGSLVPHDNLVRLAPFFQGLKDRWFHDSVTHKDDPAVMVWTSGPSDPLYAEPVSLSRYFGYPLVESRDLTVRSGKVFLKTLGGLKPVDVLVRMVPDRSFDPLSGNPGGFGGVAGLTQAVRDGTVSVTNAPGADLLGHRALLPRYADLCRQLWDEDLLLAPGPESGVAGTEEFFHEDRWSPDPVGIRLFAMRRDGGWELMPGGLVQRLDGPVFDPARFSGAKKDLWFLSTEVVPLVTLLPSGERPSEVLRGADLPSRVADDLFWLGRYTERAWVDLRFFEKWWERRQGGGPESREPGAEFLDALVKGLGILPADLEEGAEAWKVSRLSETLGAVHRISGQLLDRMSLETHRILGEFALFQAGVEGPSVPETLRQVNLRLAAFSGLAMESMTRNPGWRFLDMGRRLERAELVVDAVRECFSQEGAEDNLTLLLEVFDSTLTYRTRYRLSPQRGPVLDLLLLDESNPRSLAFQLDRLVDHVEHLPRTSTRAYWSREERSILDLTTRVRLADAMALGLEELGPFLEGLGDGLQSFGQSLHQTYLAKIDAMESLQARVRVESS